MSWTPTAKVIADAISPTGVRLTTLEVEAHRFILAEFNTHRAFSRNSASSRAIPYKKMREKAINSTAYPASWPAEQRGMQGGEELSKVAAREAKFLWAQALDATIDSADKLHAKGVHKSVINRLLEPFLPHKIIVTATEWQGFFAQRLHPDAQPEIHEAAKMMYKAMEDSKPLEFDYGDWHVPYIDDHEAIMESAWGKYFTKLEDAFKAVSVARCARVSYETHDGKRDVEKDFELYFRLKDHLPPHASPFEHVATPLEPALASGGNFRGWRQLRHDLGLG